jgi:anti-sigma28 factor (negative regulator of flagellin synthesis)
MGTREAQSNDAGWAADDDAAAGLLLAAERRARLAQIKAELEDGTYAVDPWAIATEVLRSAELKGAR